MDLIGAENDRIGHIFRPLATLSATLCHILPTPMDCGRMANHGPTAVGWGTTDAGGDVSSGPCADPAHAPTTLVLEQLKILLDLPIGHVVIVPGDLIALELGVGVDEAVAQELAEGLILLERRERLGERRG